MDIDMDTMKREMGGAFVVAWLIVGMGWGSLEAALMMAAAWMAFSGAHILPVVTWMHMMTGDLSDAEGNWMANGMRLVAQIVGAVLAIALATEVGAVETSWDLVQPGFDTPGTWEAIGMVAAGAIFWMVHTRADSAWVSAFAVMVLAGTMGMTYDVLDAGKKSVFLRRPSGKKLHVGKVGGYIHGAINYQLRSLPDTFRYGRKRLNTM